MTTMPPIFHLITRGSSRWALLWLLGVFACLPGVARAQWSVLDAGSSHDFSAAAGASTYAWTMDGASVGTSNPLFSYVPDANAVGTHWLQVKETFQDGTTASQQWGVRVRIPVPASSITYYVSPTGSDSNAGTIAMPFQTLEKARDAIRLLPRPLAAGAVTVYLRGGTYYRTSTFTLNSSDSGTSSTPIIYTAYPGENVVISTGKPIPSASFTQLAASEQSRVAPGVDPSRIWETNVSGFTNKGPYPTAYETWPVRNSLATTASLPDVFYNGSRAWLSRYPNHNPADDYLTPNMKMNGIAADVTGTSYLNSNGTYLDSSNAQVAVGGAFHYNTEDAGHVARWQSALSHGGLWLQGYWRVTWQSSVAKVLGIDSGNQVVEFAPGASPNGGFGNKYTSTAGYTGRPGNKAEPYWVINLLEEMDQPGEWCVDFSRNKLYFLMDQAGAPPDNGVVVADYSGPVVQMTGSSNVFFQSLTFDRSLGVGIDIQSGSQHNLVLGCAFRNMTNMAVYMEDGSFYNGVVSCSLSEMAAMGIQIGSKTVNGVCGDNFVVNNKMTGLSRYAQVYQPGINVQVAVTQSNQTIKTGTNSRNRIAHNYIRDTPQMGVQFNGTQGIYEYNDVSKYGTLVDDTGSFYSYEDQAGDDTFRYNYSHDTVLSNAITYDGSNRLVSGHYYGNLSQLDSLCEGESIGIGAFSQIDCVNNMSIGGGRYGSYIFTSTTQSNINNNAAVAGYYPPDFHWNPSADVLANGPNLSYASDPGFINMTGEDLRLRPDSKVLKDLPGFVPVPFEMIGLYSDEYRADGVVFPPYVTTSGGTFLAGGTEALLNGTLVYPQFEVNTSVSIYYGNTDGGTNAAAWANVMNLGTLASGSFAAHVAGVPSNQPLYYRVLATNPAGQTWSENTSAAYPSIPDVPGGVAVSPGYAQNLITWSQAVYAESYVVRRATAMDGSYTVIADGVSSTSYTDTGLVTGVSYYYTVSARNATGSSSATAPATGVPVPGTAVKADNSTSLDQGPSWILGAVPTPLDNALWNGIYSSGTAAIGSGIAVNQLQISSPSRAITINAGAGNLAIGAGGIDMSAATQNLTVGCPVVLAESQTWNVAAGRTLTVAGAIDDGGRGFGISTGGSGSVVLSGSNTFSGGLNITPPAGGLPTYKFGGNNPSGYVKLNSAAVGSVTANGRLDIMTGTTVGSISGSGNAGLIYNSGTTDTPLAFQGGSGFSMFQIGADNARATLRQSGAGAVAFSFFGYNTASPNARTTFDGGTWTLNQIGQNNTGAQTSGTVVITGTAGVSILTNTGYSHGTWSVVNGTLNFGGGVSESNGSNIPLNTSLNLNVSGSGSSLLVNGAVTLGDGGSGSNSNGLAVAGGTARMTNLTVGTAYGGRADTNTVNLSGGKLVISGTFSSVLAGTTSTSYLSTNAGSTTATIQAYQRADLAPGLVISGNPNIPDGTTIVSISGTTITLSAPASAAGTNVATTFAGGSQTNAFNWTGGQLTSATLATGAGFNGSGSSITSDTLNQTAGILAPGDIGTAGKTAITGNYQLGATGTLAVDVGGTTRASGFQTGQYDYLTVSGTTALSGSLAVSLVNGFAPSNNTAFTILDSAGTLSGAFANAAFGQRVATTGGEGSFLVNKTGNTVTLSDYRELLPPTGLLATSGSGEISLAWVAPSNAPGGTTYTVWRGSVAGGPYASVATGLTGLAYTDTGLTAGTTWYYTVTATYGGVITAATAEAGALVILLPPTGLTVTPGFTFNTLNWAAAPGATSYTVLRAASAGGPFNIIASGIVGTTYMDAALITGTTYYYIVRADSGAVQSDSTATVSGTPIPGTTTKSNNTINLDQGPSWSNGIVPTALDTARWDGGYTTGSVSIGTGLAVKQLQIASPSAAISLTVGSGPLTVGSDGIDMSAATQSLTIFPPVVLAASQTWNVATSRVLQCNAPVSDDGAGSGLTLAGPGSVLLAADNTYTGTTNLSAGTLHLGVSTGATTGALAGPLNLAGGTLRSNRTDDHTPIGGTFTASAGIIEVNKATGVFNLNAINLPAGGSNAFSTLTGANGATFVVDASPGANLTFGSNTAGLNIVLKNGNLSYSTGNTASNIRVEGGTFTSTPTDRFQLAASGQTFVVTGGAINLTSAATYGFRVGGSNSPNQAGAKNVAVSQSGGTVTAAFCSLGGTDTSAAILPSYTLSGGTLATTNSGTNSLLLGADAAGLGSTTFTLTGTGKLVIPGTISGSQSGAKQIFSITGGTLAAAAVNATNLRSSASDATNGSLIQSGGTLAPGDVGTAGRTVITGNYQLGAPASIDIDIGGTIQANGFQTGQYDFLSVSGTTILAGNLAVRLTGAFADPATSPSNAAAFTVLNSTGVLSGAFANVSFGQRVATAGGEGSFLVTQAGNAVVLSDYKTALSAIEEWRQTYFGDPAGTGTAADGYDHDGDGLVNLLEYALGGDPVSAADAPYPVVQPIPQGLRFSFLRARSDITYIVEGSSDLTHWESLATNPGSVGQTVTVDDTTGGGSRFLRLRVILTQ